MSDDEMEDYGFEYSDDDQQQDQDVDIENQYYNSKGLLEDNDLKDALQGFNRVVSMEGETKGEWGFKALKQIVKIHFKLNQDKEMIEQYKNLLSYIKSAVTRNQAEKKINSILDHISSSSNVELLQEMYQATLTALDDGRNDRLWFKVQLKLAQLWMSKADLNRTLKLVRELRKSCTRDDGSDDSSKGTQLLEVTALEIQIYTEQKNNKRLRELYHKALGVKSAIPHPRIMGVIRECGGKMHMFDRNWEAAAKDFFEAFKSYDEAGNARRVQCLKYVVLAYMLSQSQVDPFDAQEAKPYRTDPQLVAMTDLVTAYHANDIVAFERILRTNRRLIMEDPFLSSYIQDVLRNIRTQVLLKVVRPYANIKLSTLATQLTVPESEVESLLVSMILDKQLPGRIDQARGMLELRDAGEDAEERTYAAMERWADHVSSLHEGTANKVA